MLSKQSNQSNQYVSQINEGLLQLIPKYPYIFNGANLLNKSKLTDIVKPNVYYYI
jgi:hypothetical protein